MVLNCVSGVDSLAMQNSLYLDEKISSYVRKISKYRNLTLEEEQEFAKKSKRRR